MKGIRYTPIKQITERGHEVADVAELRSFLVPGVEGRIDLPNSIKEATNGSNRKAVQTRADGEFTARD